MNDVTKINNPEEMQIEAECGIEKIKAVATFFSFVDEHMFLIDDLADFVRTMGDVIMVEMGKIENNFLKN